MTLDEAIAYLRSTFRNVGEPVVRPAQQQPFDGLTAVNVRFLAETDDPDTLAQAGAGLLVDVPFGTELTGADTAYWDGVKPLDKRQTFLRRLDAEIAARLADGTWKAAVVVEARERGDEGDYAVVRVEEVVDEATGRTAPAAKVARLELGAFVFTPSDRTFPAKV